MKDLERENVIAALRAANYKVHGANGAAQLLGVKLTTLASRIKSLQIPLRPESKAAPGRRTPSSRQTG